MKKAVIVLVMLLALPRVKVQASAPQDLQGAEEEVSKNQEKVDRFFEALHKSYVVEDGECWNTTIKGLSMDYFVEFLQKLEEEEEDFGWETTEIRILEDNSFQVSIENNHYRVKDGDTLSEIALKHGTSIARLMMLNPSIKNENLIYSGEYLNMK